MRASPKKKTAVRRRPTASSKLAGMRRSLKRKRHQLEPQKKQFFTFKAVLKFGAWHPLSPRAKLGIEHASTERRIRVVTAEITGHFTKHEVQITSRTARSFPIVNRAVQDVVDIGRFRIEALRSKQAPATLRRANAKLSPRQWEALEKAARSAIEEKLIRNTKSPGLNVVVFD
jgi:hypothetical protein